MSSRSAQSLEPAPAGASSSVDQKPRSDEPPLQGWPVLIVDDDESILLISKMVLSRVSVLGKPLVLSVAHSGQQARELVAQRTFAAAIVDVVMETDTAGLDFIAWLREQPNGRATRVVVRTGQPGLAPEEEVLRTYEINDYWSKTELSARRIRTAMIGMIRSYHDLMVVEQQRKDVSDILVALPSLFSQRNATRLLNALANTTGHLFGTLNTVMMFIELSETSLEQSRVIAATDEELPDSGIPLQQRLAPQELALLEESERLGRMVAHDHSVALLLRTGSGRGVALLGRGWSGHEYWRHDLTDILVRNSLVFLETLLAQASHFHALERQLRQDDRTGLLNRRGLMEALDHGWPTQEFQALALIHMTRLRSLNQAYGQDVGDEALMAVAQRLLSLEDEACLARLEGGTFAVALRTKKAELEPFLQKVLQLFEAPFRLQCATVLLPVYVGVTPLEQAVAHRMLNQAELALKEARQRNLPTWVTYEPSMTAHDVRQGLLQTELEQVWQSEELLVHYQPIVSLQTRRVLGVEALIRWNSTRFGMLKALEFVPLAERSGLITAMTREVLLKALQALDRWKAFHPELFVAVNVSPFSLVEPDFVPMILEVLGERDAQSLHLELTESDNLVQDAYCRQQLTQLRARGIRFLLDDFGTGPLPIPLLHQLPIDALKIDCSQDRMAALQLAGSHRPPLETLLAVADSLHLPVTAAGIETEAQAAHLHQLGCLHGQGYLFGQPLPEAELTSRLCQVSS